MLISIVTAVRDREKTIGAAIASLQSQTYTHYEHLIQDGSSTDGTLGIVEALADHRTKMKSEPDTGVYDGINRGLSRSSGEILGLLHSDDRFATPYVLERVAHVLSDPDLDGVYGDLQYVSGRGNRRVIRHWRAGDFHDPQLIRGWMPPHPTLFLRRRVLERFGCYDTRYRIAADYDALLRWLVKGKITLGYIPEVMVQMEVGGASNGSARKILRKMIEDYRAIKEHKVGGVKTLFAKNARKLGQVRWMSLLSETCSRDRK